MDVKYMLFRVKLFFLDLVQRILSLLNLAVIIRPMSIVENEFIISFIAPKPCGKELLLIGDGYDGSYIVPNDFEGVRKCFSPGVGPSIIFEQNLFDQYGISSLLIDASIDKVPSDRTDFYSFKPLFLGAIDYSNVISLETWVSEYSDDGGEEFILQMDIEGAEYQSLLSCPYSTLKKFRIILLELHFLDAANVDFMYPMIEQALRKLDAHYTVCYSRANDCCGYIKIGEKLIPRTIELTLIRKDRVEEINRVNQIFEFCISNKSRPGVKKV